MNELNRYRLSKLIINVIGVTVALALIVTQSEAVNYRGQWFKGDTHCHTDHSDGGLNQLADWLPRDVTPQTHIDLAIQRGMHFLVITDHRTISPVYDELFYSEDLLLITGEEWGGSPHGTMFGINDQIEQASHHDRYSIKTALNLAHAQGALFTESHPANDDDWTSPPPDNHWNIRYMDTIEIWNGPYHLSPHLVVMDYWEQLLNMGRHITGIGASDTHFKQLNLASGVGKPCTHVYARELTELAILEGIREGHVYITSEPGAPTLSFTADCDGDGIFESMMGDICNPTADQVTFRVNVQDAPLAQIYVYTNDGMLLDQVIDGINETIYFTQPALNAWYRVEVSRKVSDLPEEDHLAQMLALSNPIYIEPNAAQTPTPPPTPPRNRLPQILMAGLLNTDLKAGEAGQLHLMAWVTAEETNGMNEVYLGFQGVRTGVQLKDDGQHGDGSAGDDIFGFALELTADDTALAAGRYTLELFPVDGNGLQGPAYPFLVVK